MIPKRLNISQQNWWKQNTSLDPRNRQVLDNDEAENSQETKVFAAIQVIFYKNHFFCVGWFIQKAVTHSTCHNQNDEIDQDDVDEGVCDDAQLKDATTASYKQVNQHCSLIYLKY